MNNYAMTQTAAVLAANPQCFGKESGVRHPSETPYFADSIMYRYNVLSTDVLAANVYTGDDASGGGMGRLSIARHGSTAAPKGNQPANSGIYNSARIILSVADGHAESTKLNAWKNYYWNATWPN